VRTIAIVNQKGGCGKTTTAINLSGFLAQEGRRVLLVDMDPQGHATLGLLADKTPPPRTMYDVFVARPGMSRTALRDVVRPAAGNVDVAPSDILLSGVPDQIATAFGRENLLAEALAEIRDDYDYAIIDCPPSVGILTFNALKACAEAIVPMDPSFFALHGIGKLLETLDVLARKSGHHIAARVLVTLYPGRGQFAREVVDEVRRHLPDRHFDTIIRYSVKLAEAASHGQPIASYCRHCVGFEDYKALAAEVIQQESSRPVPERVRRRAQDRGTRPALVSRLGPTVTPEGVVFALEAPGASRVQLVGDFNNWTLEGSDMQAAGRVWTKTLNLEPGRYLYRYVVDGHWRSDPLNANVEPAPFGGHNSVLELDTPADDQEPVDAAG